jgi:hypothetical protein
MSESSDDASHEEQPQHDVPAEELPAEEQPSDTAGDPDVGPSGAPAAGGYGDRDPKTDMPRVPSRPDAEDDE